MRMISSPAQQGAALGQFFRCASKLPVSLVVRRQITIMAFRSFIRSLFGVGRDSCSGLQGRAENKKALYVRGRFNLDEWVKNQKSAYGFREGLSEDLDRRASQFNSASLGLSGTLLDHLFAQCPRMIPKNVWGGDLGWRSAKREKRWESLLTQNGIIAPSTCLSGSPLTQQSGFLIRMRHRIGQHSTLTFSPDTLFRAKKPSNFVYSGELKNSIALTRRIAERVQGFPVRIGANYLCHEHADYADIAFLLPASGTDLLQVKTIWKGEAALAELVKSIFPDACREYSPPWLRGATH